MNARFDSQVTRLAACAALTAALLLTAAQPAAAWEGPGSVLSHQKISSIEGGFNGPLRDGDWFSFGTASLGDLDGDGVGDLAVGAVADGDGGPWKGAVWILFLNIDGTVEAEQKISELAGGFTGDLDDYEYFGVSVASLGDLDGDGPSALALAVGAVGDDDGGEGPDADHGAVWVLFLNTNGTVMSHQKISDKEGNFKGNLNDFSCFGYAVASLGDLDDDGVDDMVVGANWDVAGSVWVLFLNADGTVKSHMKIGDKEGGFTGDLDVGDQFGRSTAFMGDLDGDGVGDLAIGTFQDDDGGEDFGAVWMLFLDTDGTVKSQQKISAAEGNFTGKLNIEDRFGTGVASMGDINGDGVGDLAVGALRDDDGGPDKGAVWMLFLDTNGTVKWHQKISDLEGNFTDKLHDFDQFGVSVASLGDHDGDGLTDLAVGVRNDDDGGQDRGAVYVLFLDGVGGCARDPEWMCDGDVDGDAQVNPVDSGLVQAAFGSIDDQDLCNYDVDCDGQINPVDSGIVQSLFGTCDPPRGACP